MSGFDEFLYLHPLSVSGRLAESRPRPRRKSAPKPKRAISERIQLFRRLQIRPATT